MRLAKRSRLDFFGGGGDAIVDEVEVRKDGYRTFVLAWLHGLV